MLRKQSKNLLLIASLAQHKNLLNENSRELNNRSEWDFGWKCEWKEISYTFRDVVGGTVRHIRHGMSFGMRASDSRLSPSPRSFSKRLESRKSLTHDASTGACTHSHLTATLHLLLRLSRQETKNKSENKQQRRTINFPKQIKRCYLRIISQVRARNKDASRLVAHSSWIAFHARCVLNTPVVQHWLAI